MAIVNCPECGGQASSSAQACPRCGYGIAAHVQQVAAEEAKKKKNKRNMIIGGVIFALLSSCCLFSTITNSCNEAEEQERKQAEAEAKEAERQAEIAKIKENMDGYVTRLNEALKEERLGDASTVRRMIQKAEPNHPVLKETQTAYEELAAKQKAKNNTEQAAKLLEQGDGLADDKSHFEADGKYTKALSLLATIDEELQTDEGKKLATKIERQQKRIARQVKKKKAEIAKQKAEQEELTRVCGGQSPCIRVPAGRLFQDYQANEVRADEEYKGVTLVVYGDVASIDKGILDSIHVRLQTSNQFMSVLAMMEKSEKAEASGLSKGQEVQVRCVGTGMTMGSPSLDDCVFVD
jgi:ribosomal protein L37E